MDIITYKVMIPFLQMVVKTTQSYGLAIIMLTLAVRALVWHLVTISTKNMQKMQKLSPMMKALQARYKEDPELLQRKMMEFWSKNKINPMGGCLPMLVQLPILFALFGTFNGPPFADRAVDVPVKVQEVATVKREHKEVSGANCPYVSKDGQLAKVVVFPGDSTVAVGEKIDFGTRAVEGTVPADFKVKWYVKHDNKPATPEQATIDEAGHAVFLQKGDYRVEAAIDGVAKNDSFLFINSLGKKATGLDLFKPENWDLLAMIVLFSATMWASSKLTMTAPKDPSEMDEQQRVSQDTAKMMPIVMGITFIMFPLPAGVYLYMTVSSIVQTLQTWLVMRSPAPDLIDPDGPQAGGPGGPGSSSGPIAGPSVGKGNANKGGGKGQVIDIGTAPTPEENGNGKKDKEEGATIKFDSDKLDGRKDFETMEQGKSKKKKKK